MMIYELAAALLIGSGLASGVLHQRLGALVTGTRRCRIPLCTRPAVDDVCPHHRHTSTPF